MFAFWFPLKSKNSSELLELLPSLGDVCQACPAGSQLQWSVTVIELAATEPRPEARRGPHRGPWGLVKRSNKWTKIWGVSENRGVSPQIIPF